MLPPNVSTSSRGTIDAISSAARHKSAFTGMLLSKRFFSPRSDNFIPPGLPVNMDTGSSESLIGVEVVLEQEDRINTMLKVNDDIPKSRVNLQNH
jgi:hypothetical protein